MNLLLIITGIVAVVFLTVAIHFRAKICLWLFLKTRSYNVISDLLKEGLCLGPWSQGTLERVYLSKEDSAQRLLANLAYLRESDTVSKATDRISELSFDHFFVLDHSEIYTRKCSCEQLRRLLERVSLVLYSGAYPGERQASLNGCAELLHLLVKRFGMRAMETHAYQALGLLIQNLYRFRKYDPNRLEEFYKMLDAGSLKRAYEIVLEGDRKKRAELSGSS